MSRRPPLDVSDRDEFEMLANELDERPGRDEFEPAAFDDLRLAARYGAADGHFAFETNRYDDHLF